MLATCTIAPSSALPLLSLTESKLLSVVLSPNRGKRAPDSTKSDCARASVKRARHAAEFHSPVEVTLLTASDLNSMTATVSSGSPLGIQNGACEVKDKSAENRPSYWANGSGVHRTLFVENELQRLLRSTSSGCACHHGRLDAARVMCVQRVENAPLWQRYSSWRQRSRDLVDNAHTRATAAASLPEQRCRPLNMELADDELFLFHGTGGAAAASIAEEGLDPAEAHRNSRYGRGVYFTDQACKAHQYATRAAPGSAAARSGLFCVIVCRVAPGRILPFRVTKANQDRGFLVGMKAPAPGDPVFDREMREAAAAAAAAAADHPSPAPSEVHESICETAAAAAVAADCPSSAPSEVRESICETAAAAAAAAADRPSSAPSAAWDSLDVAPSTKEERELQAHREIVVFARDASYPEFIVWYRTDTEEEERAVHETKAARDAALARRITYSEKYEDESFEYRHVVLPAELAESLPSRLLTESEWRRIGIQQSRGWVHYAIHPPEPNILLFRRPLGTDPVSGKVAPKLEREAKARSKLTIPTLV